MTGAKRYSTDPRFWEPGMTIKHVQGEVRTLKERKPDNTGWWMTDGSGLHDDMVVGGVWIVVSS